MKLAIKSILYFISFVILIVSLVMIFFEARLLISGDWLLYPNKFNAFVRYFFRLIIAFAYLFMVLCVFIKSLKKNKIVSKYIFNLEIALLIVSLIILLISSNFEGHVIFTLMIVYMVFKLCEYKLIKDK